MIKTWFAKSKSNEQDIQSLIAENQILKQEIVRLEDQCSEYRVTIRNLRDHISSARYEERIDW